MLSFSLTKPAVVHESQLFARKAPIYFAVSQVTVFLAKRSLSVNFSFTLGD